MLNIQNLREQRHKLAAEMKQLLADNPGEKWAQNSANQSTYDEKLAKIDVLDAEIDRINKLADRVADEALGTAIANNARRRGVDVPDTDPHKILDNWLRGGDRAITDQQWTAIRNTMSTTTNSEGGFTVPSEIASTFIDTLKAFGGMRSVSEIITTADGRALNYPTSDGTSEVGEIVAENVNAADLDPTFGTVALGVFKYSSRVVTVPIELIQDSTINIEAMVNARLGQRLGRITNTHYTVGTGTGQPRGIVTAATSGKVGTTGSTLTASYDDLVDLQHSVDPEYRALGASWMMNDLTLRNVRKLKDSQNRPLWEPSLQVGAPSILLGAPVVINQDVAVMAANARSILFGAFNYAYKIRDALQVTLFRFTDSAFARKGQVGFLAWMRTGGNCVDTNAVKFYQNSAT